MPGSAALELVEEPHRPAGAVGAHVVCADLAEPRVVHVQRLLVRREGEPVGIDRVADRRAQVAGGRAFRPDPEHALEVEVLLEVVGLHPRVVQRARRIREPDRAVRLDYDVVRAVDPLAAEFRGERLDAAVRLDAPHRARCPAGDEEPALAVERQAVRVRRGPLEHFGAAAARAPPDRVADDVDPPEAAVAPVPHRPFAEAHAVVQALELRVAWNEACEPGRGAIDVNHLRRETRRRRRTVFPSGCAMRAARRAAPRCRRPSGALRRGRAPA